MKKQILLLAALSVSLFANAQKEVNMEKLWKVSEGAVEINDAMTVKDGVAFVGDTRTPDKIEDGVYKGMKVQSRKKHFSFGSGTIQYFNAMSFRGAASGMKTNGEVDVNNVPTSRLVQVKPLAGGKFQVYAEGTKPVVQHLYIGVRNGSTFKNLAVLDYQKDASVTGKKDAPFESQEVKYEYADGDELWFYSDGGVNLYAISFKALFLYINSTISKF